MKLEFRPSFNRDFRSIQQEALRRRLTRKLDELESASRITEVSNVSRMAGGSNLYRVRIGQHRLVIEVEGTVVFLVRFGHRREVYSWFR